MRKSLYGYDKRHVEGVEEAIDALLPLVLVANVILAPCATEIVCVWLIGLDVLDYAKSMTGDGAFGLVIEELLALGSVGEKGCNVELEAVTLGLVSGVGILYVVLSNDNALRIGSVDNNAGGKVAWCGESCIPYGHLVEVGAFVKADDAVLNNILVVLDLHGIVRKLYGEAQWSVVDNAVFLVAIWEDEIVAIHERRCSATK